jgi:hypothetical protein
MDDEAFLARMADEAGTAAISAGEIDAVLDLARVVAHGVQRRFAPLTAYALGLALAADGDPREREARVRGLINHVEDLIRG